MTLGSTVSRLVRVVCLIAVLAAVSAGCSAGSAPPTATAAQTRTVTDVTGEQVEVPAQPQRVVPLSEPTLDGVLALGVKPIGTVSGRGQSGVPNYLVEAAGDVPLLGGIGQPNFEAIGAATPDLILVDGTSVNNNPEVLERLAAQPAGGRGDPVHRPRLPQGGDPLCQDR